MRYRIIYDGPGRLRLRCGMYAFSETQGYALTALLRQNPSVYAAEATYRNGGLLIRYNPDPEAGGREAVLAQVRAIDGAALAAGDPTEAERARKLDGDFQLRLLRLVGAHVARRLFLPQLLRNAWTVLRAGRYVGRGLAALWHGKLNVDVLDAASISAALAQGSFRTAGSVMLLLSVSSELEAYTRRRTHDALARSLSLQVEQVWRVDDTGETLTPMAEVCAGDVIRLRSGQLIPLDGQVCAGEALVNEASLTGEALPVRKSAGDTVYAASVLEEGLLDVQVTALSGANRIDQIMELIDHSEMLKASVQNRAEHLADAIVPYSFLGALAVLALTRNWNKALSVLMVDYSCAIKLSTPISVISAMKEASDHGIVVKGGKYFELFAEADCIVFDKTGTLTEACPRLARVIPFGKYSREEILRIAACLEEHFPHSVARAIVRQAEEEGLLHAEKHADVEYVVAHGISSQLNGRRCLIGSPHFIVEDEGIPITRKQREQIQAEQGGCSAIYLAIGRSLVGVLLIDDPPRPEAAEVIAQLKQEGITNVCMLTGDSESAARAVADALGIPTYRAQVLPADKSSMVESLKFLYRRLIMVGDGINDSPALAAADVSVAMQDASDLAREVADITLLRNDLHDLVFLRRLSTRLLRRIHRNYRFILLFNTGLLLSGLAGVLTPTVSAYLHNFSTMLISAASMRPCLPEPRREGGAHAK